MYGQLVLLSELGRDVNGHSDNERVRGWFPRAAVVAVTTPQAQDNKMGGDVPKKLQKKRQ